MVARIINTLLGIWLMVAPEIFGWNKTVSDNDHIIGPVIVTMAFTAIWEATRGLRHVNTLLGSWLLLAPWVLGYAESSAIVSDMATGAMVVILSRLGGKTKQSFGGGWAAIFKPDRRHALEAKKRQARHTG